VIFILLLIKVVTDPNMLPEEHVKCMRDGILRLTEGANDYFAQNSRAKKILIATFAMILDLGLLI
jgi:hypothetical protein